jgi:hypothetical protein
MRMQALWYLLGALVKLASGETSQLPEEFLDEVEHERTETIWRKPEGVILKGITSSGSGCPQEAILIKGHPLPGLTFSTSKLFSIGGVGQAITDIRKFCQIALELEIESGYQVAVHRVSMQSYASLNENIKATLTGSHYFSGKESVCFFIKLCTKLIRTDILGLRNRRPST